MHRYPSYVHREIIKAFGITIASGTKIFDMPKNYRKDTRWFNFVLSSRVHPGLRKAIVRPSGLHRLLSCGHRHHRLGFATRRQYEGHTMLPDCVRKATRHRVAFATPSYKHRIRKIKNTMASGWKHDINLNCSNISRGNVDIQKIKKNQHPHNIIIRSLKWNTVKSWHI